MVGASLGPLGGVAPAGGFPIIAGPAHASSAVPAYNPVDGSYLVTYAERPNGAAAADIKAIRASAVASAPVVVSADPNDQYYPALASVDHRFLIVWTDLRNQAVTSLDVWGAVTHSAGLITPEFLIRD